MLERYSLLYITLQSIYYLGMQYTTYTQYNVPLQHQPKSKLTHSMTFLSMQ